MREFLLVVTDLLRDPPDADKADGGALASLRFGAARALPGGDWRSWLSPRLEAAYRDGRSLAATVAAAQPDPGLPAKGAWLATPLHLVAGLDTLHLPENTVSRIAFDATNVGRWAIRSTIAEHYDAGIYTWFEVTA